MKPITKYRDAYARPNAVMIACVSIAPGYNIFCRREGTISNIM